MGARGGIDLGGTKIQAVVLDEAGEVRGDARHPTPTIGEPQDVVHALARALEEAARQAGIPAGELDGVGVGSPGAVDTRAGTVTSARNLPNWEGSFPLAEALSTEIGTEVRVGNDVGVATLGEFRLGAGRPYRSLLGLFWGTGVGGGLILEGEYWRGRRSAGEIGHTVVEMDGAPCTCGRRGCMEAYAGRGAMEIEARRRAEAGEDTKLFTLMEHHGRDRLASGIWARALRKHDAMAESLIGRAIEALGAAAASAVNLLDLEAVIIGGGLGTRFGQPAVKQIQGAMLPHLFRDDDPPDVLLAELGDLGGAIGASLLLDEAPDGGGGGSGGSDLRRPGRFASAKVKTPAEEAVSASGAVASTEASAD